MARDSPSASISSCSCSLQLPQFKCASHAPFETTVAHLASTAYEVASSSFRNFSKHLLALRLTGCSNFAPNGVHYYIQLTQYVQAQPATPPPNWKRVLIPIPIRISHAATSNSELTPCEPSYEKCGNSQPYPSTVPPKGSRACGAPAIADHPVISRGLSTTTGLL